MLHPGLFLTPCPQPSLHQLGLSQRSSISTHLGVQGQRVAVVVTLLFLRAAVCQRGMWWQEQRLFLLPLVSPLMLGLFASALEARKACFSP